MKPSLFKNTNINPTNHNKKQTVVKEVTTNIEEVLDIIFKNKYPFNTKVLLETNNKKIETYLVKRNEKEVITLDEEIIPINEIINITIKKKDFF